MLKKILILTLLSISVFGLDSSYIEKLHKKDISVMQKAGIDVKENFPETNIDWAIGESALLEMAKQFLNEKHDVMNAYKIMNYLNLSAGGKDEYLFYLGQCYYFIGELYYEGYIDKYYRQAYDLFSRLVSKNKKNIEYLRWKSFAAAKVGGFIRHKEDGKFSGLSYLRESISLNDDILDINKNDEDAVITEAEYQIQTDNVPVFGGSKEKGLKLYFQVYNRNPNNMRVNLLLGKYYYQNGDAKKALGFLFKAIEVYDKKWVKTDIIAYYMRIFAEMHLVRAYGILNDQANRWARIQAHLSLLPRSPSGLAALAEYLAANNQKKNACDISKRLVEMDPYGRRQNYISSNCQ